MITVEENCKEVHKRACYLLADMAGVIVKYEEKKQKGEVLSEREIYMLNDARITSRLMGYILFPLSDFFEKEFPDGKAIILALEYGNRKTLESFEAFEKWKFSKRFKDIVDDITSEKQ